MNQLSKFNGEMREFLTYIHNVENKLKILAKSYLLSPDQITRRSAIPALPIYANNAALTIAQNKQH
jgi:hypothetical protein